MTTRTATLAYPLGGFGAPKDRQGHAGADIGLPAGTEVFSADNHISLAEDIFYERFPESMKEQAPRVVCEDGAWTLVSAANPYGDGSESPVLRAFAKGGQVASLAGWIGGAGE